MMPLSLAVFCNPSSPLLFFWVLSIYALAWDKFLFQKEKIAFKLVFVVILGLFFLFDDQDLHKPITFILSYAG